jgi:regulator of sigma E protease
VLPNSPAQKADLQVGDRIVTFDGKVQRDFTKIQLNVALVKEGESVPVEVYRHDDPNQKQTLQITAGRGDADTTGFLQLGIGPSPQLEGPSQKDLPDDFDELKKLSPPDMFALNPGEKVVAIAGQAIDPNDPHQLQSYWKLYRAVQDSQGKPVTVTVSDGKSTRDVQAIPRFQFPFAGTVNFAGLEPRASILAIEQSSDARGKLQPDDEIVSVTVNTDTKRHPSADSFKSILKSAGENNQPLTIVVNRKGQQLEFKDLKTAKIQGGDRGLGVSRGFDAESAVIGAVVSGSTAENAGISVNDSSDVVVTKLGDEPVKSFHDIKRIIASAKPGKLAIVTTSDAGEKTSELNLTEQDISGAKNQTYQVSMAIGLHPLSQPRKTKSFATAALWGGEETRDLIVQFYITLQRMFSGSVPAKNMMGPYGIVKAGAGFADKGLDYLIWFLAMISANLAVVNFLPIPIVDGGLFMFLIIEKFQGKPLSPRVQSIAQLVGIALIASVFIFVTYQDIIRR